MDYLEGRPDILTADEAADVLRVDRDTIYRYIHTGKLNASRIGREFRIPRHSIELLMLATRVRPDIELRRFTDEQVADFLEADRMDDETGHAALNSAHVMDSAEGQIQVAPVPKV